MPNQFGEFLQEHGWSPGVILVPRHLLIGEAIAELVLIGGASEAGEWQNRIGTIPLR
jgi:hypothetical protein